MTNMTARAERFSALVAQRMVLEAKARGINQAQLAEAIGKFSPDISHYKAGRHLMPTSVVVQAAEVIGIAPEVIVARAYETLLAELGAPAPTRERAAGTSPIAGPPVAAVPLRKKRSTGNRSGRKA